MKTNSYDLSRYVCDFNFFSSNFSFQFFFSCCRSSSSEDFLEDDRVEKERNNGTSAILLSSMVDFFNHAGMLFNFLTDKLCYWPHKSCWGWCSSSNYIRERWRPSTFLDTPVKYVFPCSLECQLCQHALHETEGEVLYSIFRGPGTSLECNRRLVSPGFQRRQSISIPWVHLASSRAIFRICLRIWQFFKTLKKDSGSGVVLCFGIDGGPSPFDLKASPKVSIRFCTSFPCMWNVVKKKQTYWMLNPISLSFLTVPKSKFGLCARVVGLPRTLDILYSSKMSCWYLVSLAS